VLGALADVTGIDTVYRICAFLPLIGLLTALLPNLGRPLPPVAVRAAAE
jgi:MFS transporter, FSR family, fosmidomycin resistance protein